MKSVTKIFMIASVAGLLQGCDENISYSFYQDTPSEYQDTEVIADEAVAESTVFSIEGSVYSDPDEVHVETLIIDIENEELKEFHERFLGVPQGKGTVISGALVMMAPLYEGDAPQYGTDMTWIVDSRLKLISEEGEVKAKKSKECGTINAFEGRRTYQVQMFLTRRGKEILVRTLKTVNFGEMKCIRR